jgi:integrase
MARLLNPVTGVVEEIDDSLTGWMDELWAHLGAPDGYPLGLPAEAADVLTGTYPAAVKSLAQAQTVRESELAARGVSAAREAFAEAVTAPPKRPRRDRRLIVPWSSQTCARVRDGLPQRYRALVDTGQGLGLRFGELSAVALEDLDRGNVLVRRQVKRVDGALVWAPPKDGSSGCLPLDRQLAATLRDHAGRYPAAAVTLPWDTPGGQRETFRILFSGQAGGPLDRSYFLRIWRTAVSAAGMTPSRTTGTHQLRHHFASELVAGGTDLETVRRLLRHADLLTTQQYVHSLAISDRQARKAVAKVTPKAKPTVGDELAARRALRARRAGS